MSNKFQKQPPELLYKKKLFLKIWKYSQETPALESLFNKVVGVGLQLY